MSQEISNLSIQQAIQNFLINVERGHSKATAKTYQVGLNQFTRYLEQELKKPVSTTPLSELSPDWAVNFLRYRVDNPAVGATTTAKTTISTYSAALARFYKWCSIERLIVLPAEEYERLQIRLRELKGKERPTILNKVPADDIVAALIEEVRKPSAAQPKVELDRTKQELIWLRDIAILETLKCTGARVSEVCGLVRGDLDATNRRARTLGKGKKERWLYFSAAAWEALQDYLVARTKAMKIASAESGRSRHNSAQPLFARHDRGADLSTVKPLTPRAIQRLLVELVERAELDSNITPHKFRHWVATRLLSATGDLAATQDLLGHASPNTTRIYAQVSEQTKQDIHRKVFQ